MVVLPALGILVGIFIRAGLPYAAGCWVCFVAVWLCSGGTFRWEVAVTLSAVWAFFVWLARSKHQERNGSKFGWHEGHYRGALICLMLFAPFWKRSKGEIEPELKVCQSEV
jgi:hypothetical protein